MNSAHSTRREALRSLLRERNEHPERLSEIDERIRAAFSARRAILVLDMSGFSRLTNTYGIIHFLAMIQRMHDLVLPVIADPARGGNLLRCEADNVFARFPDVLPAIEAAIEMQRQLETVNAILPEDWDVRVAIGIGYGDLLMVGEDDLYGAEMNLASRLGEDLGGPGEILLTEAAAARLPAGRFPLRTQTATVGALSLSYLRVVTAAGGEG